MHLDGHLSRTEDMINFGPSVFYQFSGQQKRKKLEQKCSNFASPVRRPQKRETIPSWCYNFSSVLGGHYSFFFENSNFTTLQRVWLESPFIFLTFLQMGKVAFSAYSVDLGVPSSNNVM